jgi:iron complex outermembrane receptor protein
MAGALVEFANQTGLQLVYETRIAAKRASKGARAGLPPAETLTQLLDGSGLSFQFLNPRAIRIFELTDAASVARMTTAEVPVNRPEGRTDPGGRLGDVVVLGSRGAERLSKAPFSIAAWTSQAMETSGIDSFDQIALLTPGVEYDLDTSLGPGIARNVSIRGVNNTGGSTTTRIFVDDTPVHSMQSTFGDAFPVTFDLARVEVLRGPQGALLGEGAEGGIVRFIHNEPSLTAFSGQARAEIATTRNGAASYEAGAAGGGPLAQDTMGFRVSAWYRIDGGYIDRVNPFTGAVVDANSNRLSSKSIRGALTWVPTGSVQISPSVMYQSIGLHDAPVFYEYLSLPSAGLFRSGRLVRQPSDDSFTLTALKVTATLPFGILSSNTAYFDRRAVATADITNIYCWVGDRCQSPLGREYPSSYADALSSILTLGGTTFGQELRLASPRPGARVTWLIGAQYSGTTQNDARQDYDNLGVALHDQYRASQGREVQRAVFGEAEIGMLPQLTATVGLRLARDSYSWRSTPFALDFNGNCCVAFSERETDSPFAPKIGLSFEPDQNHLLYATVAKGYRMGGVNPQRLTACFAQPPQVFNPDAVWNYEIGSKNTAVGSRLQLDVSAYHMSWRNLQQAIDVPCYFGWNSNGAAINGFDLAVRALLTRRLKLDLAVAYADARFTESVTSLGRPLTHSGDAIGTLPQVPSPWNATVSMDYSVPWGGGPSITIHVEDAIHSHNPGPFTRPIEVYPAGSHSDPATNLLNLRVTIGWSDAGLNLFVDNAWGSQPTLQGKSEVGVPGATLFYATTFRPRTVGISLDVRY